MTLSLPALGAAPGVRMYVLDCGSMSIRDMALFSDTGKYDGQSGSIVDTLASMDRIESIIRNTHARLIVQHDPGDYSRLPKSPAYLE